MVNSFQIGPRGIGPGQPCYIIAEAGVNHDGSLATAHKLIDAAVEAGADAVKFQTWITERLCAPGARKAEYQTHNSPDDIDQFEMLKRLELPYEWHEELMAHALDKGIDFLSTPDEIQSAEFLCQIGVPLLKIGSAELTNHLFLSQIARLGKPVILSTGMGNYAEIEAAIKIINSENEIPLAFLHCVSAYPSPESEMNLRCIGEMRHRFQLPVGLSDHTTGFVAAVVATGIGMDILEKHLTLDKRAIGPDHAASANPSEFSEMVRFVRRAEAMLGDGVKKMAPSEFGTKAAVRRSLFFKEDLAKGQCVKIEHLEALRTDFPGIEAEDLLRVIGQSLAKTKKRGEQMQYSDFE